MKRSNLLFGAILLAGCGTDLAGPPSSMLACVYGAPRVLQVGEVIRFQGTGNRSVCLTTRDSTAVFAYIPFFAVPDPQNGDRDTRLAIDVLGGGILGPPALAAARPDAWTSGPGAPGPAHAAVDPLRLGHDLHHRIRDRELAELGPRIRAGRSAVRPRRDGEPGLDPGARLDRAPDAVPARAAGVPVAGDTMTFNVALRCTSRDDRAGRVVRVSDHAILVADLQNPNGFTSEDFQALGAAFDSLVYPVAVRHFGEPSDIDANGRTVIFFTRAVNQLNEAGSGTFTAGLFWAGDLFPATATQRLEACPAGNHAEMFYMAVPDAAGAVGPQVSVQWLRDRAVQVMAHEYQHLLNAARRIHVNSAPVFERTWLNEGLSHIAEELVFFEASGLPRASNITNALLQSTPGAAMAYYLYMNTNHHNLGRYLANPHVASLWGADDFSTRGATWSFLRYAADRTGAGDEAVFFALLNSASSGIENLDQALGGPALAWMQDWAVALLADDHVPGIDPAFTQPSWNFRDIHRIPGGGYPLVPISLAAGEAKSVHLLPGGSAYLMFGVDVDRTAAIHLEAGGTAPPRSLRGAFLRIR